MAAAMVVVAAGANMCIRGIKHILLLLRVVCNLRHGSGGSRHGSGGLGTQSFRGRSKFIVSGLLRAITEKHELEVLDTLGP